MRIYSAPLNVTNGEPGRAPTNAANQDAPDRNPRSPACVRASAWGLQQIERGASFRLPSRAALDSRAGRLMHGPSKGNHSAAPRVSKRLDECLLSLPFPQEMVRGSRQSTNLPELAGAPRRRSSPNDSSQSRRLRDAGPGQTNARTRRQQRKARDRGEVSRGCCRSFASAVRPPQRVDEEMHSAGRAGKKETHRLPCTC